MTAVNAALDKVGVGLLGNHVRGCVREAVTSDGGDDKVDELVGVISRFLKT